MSRKLFAIALAVLFLTCGASVLTAGTSESSDTKSATVFPPANCSSKFERIITWKNGDQTTYCRTLDSIVKLALPHCKNGQVLAMENNKLVCRTVGAVDLGREFRGAYCANSNHCYVFCPQGKVVMTGGCFSNRAYSLQGSKPVVYDRPVVGNGGHNPGSPDGASSVAPGPNAYEGWQCIYPTASSPPTDIEAHVICINSGLEAGNGPDDDGSDEDGGGPGRDPI